MKRSVLFTLSITLVFSLFSHLSAKQGERFLVRITAPPSQIKILSEMPFDFASMAVRDYMDVIITQEELIGLLAKGYKVEILQRESDLFGSPIDLYYHTYEETYDYLQLVEQTYPQITKLHRIGRSTRFGYPIWALKISDNPHLKEDEFSMLIDGMHHAREPLGNEVCLAFIDHLVSRYGWDPKVTAWVDDYEIWVIPILNPEGYKYIVDNNLSNPWWRKNLRDNNGNGTVDADFDGVDLNRNYDINWTFAGSADPTSWTYRGPFPFSEEETQAKRELAIREKFVLSLTYHSYGEIIYYQWAWPGTSVTAPDHKILSKIASEMAKRIINLSGTGTYSYGRQTAANQSSPWMYGILGTLEFLVETGTSFIPLGPEVNSIVEANLEALFYILDRMKGPGVKGLVLDRLTRLPIEASVSVKEVDDFRYIQPRKNNPSNGKFVRLLEPGAYTLSVSSPGYFSNKAQVNIGQNMEEIIISLASLEDSRTRRRTPRK